MIPANDVMVDVVSSSFETCAILSASIPKRNRHFDRLILFPRKLKCFAVAVECHMFCDVQWYYSEKASEILKLWIYLKTPENISINIASNDKLIEDSDSGRLF